MRIGMLTGGGDCPGLNAVLRAAVRKGERQYGDEFVGFRHGWRGVVENETMPLSVRTTRGLLPRGGVPRAAILIPSGLEPAEKTGLHRRRLPSPRGCPK